MHMRWILAASALAISTSAFGEEAAPAAPGASAQNSIGDIVVTARRREESSLKVPVAVTAFGAEALRSKSINTQDDLVSHTASLTITPQSGRREQGAFFMRGQGQTYGSQPGVITYVDEVPSFQQALLGSNATFFDLSSIQVLKGPQGTLFGRSTTGGAVLLTSARPTNDLSGNLQASYGNYNAVDIQGALNVPIIKDKVLLRVAGDFVRRHGYTVSSVTGQDQDNRHRESFRVSLLVKPVDGIENLLIFSGQNIKENNTGIVMGGFNTTWTPGGGLKPYLSNNVQTIGLFCGAGIAGSVATGNQAAVLGCPGISRLTALWGTPNAATGVFPATGGLVNSILAEQARIAAGGSIRQNADPFLTSTVGNQQNITNTTTLHQDGVGVLGDITVKNIFATNRVGRADSVWDLSAVGAAVAYNTFNIINGALVTQPNAQDFFQNFSDEFQVQGHTKLMDWSVGYYYNFQKIPFSLAPLFRTFATALNRVSPFGLPDPSGKVVFDNRSTDKGVYAQATVHPFEGASITGGIRRSNYTQAQLNATQAYDPAHPENGFIWGTSAAVPYVNQGATSYNFAADYKPMDGMLVYVASRRGFKPGGINAGNGSTFLPEIVTDYEAGVKYAWRGPIAGRITLDGYTSKYANVQRNFTIANPSGAGVLTGISNIAAATIKGVEFESELRVGPKLTVGLNASYTDAKYTDWKDDFGGDYDAAGNVYHNINTPFMNTPKFTWSLNARYLLIDQANLGQVSVSGNYYHQSWVNLDDSIMQDPLHRGGQKAYGTLNLRADWSNVAGKPVDLFLNATNVADQVHLVGATNLLVAAGPLGVIYGEPRMVTGGVRVHF